MALASYADETITRMMDPLDWRDIKNDPRTMINRKRARAKELGVAAVLLDKYQTRDRTERLAELEHHLRGGEIDNTLYMGVLRGAVPFVKDFATAMAALTPRVNPRIDYVETNRYGNTQTGKPLRLVSGLSPETDIAGKTLMVIDDLVHHGVTLERLTGWGLSEENCTVLGIGVTGPAERAGAIIMGDKRLTDMPTLNANMVLRGFWLPDVWVAGNGLNGQDEEFRWIPEIVIPRKQEEQYRANMPEVLDVLGDAAVLTMKDFIWT